MGPFLKQTAIWPILSARCAALNENPRPFPNSLWCWITGQKSLNPATSPVTGEVSSLACGARPNLLPPYQKLLSTSRMRALKGKFNHQYIDSSTVRDSTDTATLAFLIFSLFLHPSCYHPVINPTLQDAGFLFYLQGSGPKLSLPVLQTQHLIPRKDDLITRLAHLLGLHWPFDFSHVEDAVSCHGTTDILVHINEVVFYFYADAASALESLIWCLKLFPSTIPNCGAAFSISERSQHHLKILNPQYFRNPRPCGTQSYSSSKGGNISKTQVTFQRVFEFPEPPYQPLKEPKAAKGLILDKVVKPNHIQDAIWGLPTAALKQAVFALSDNPPRFLPGLPASGETSHPGLTGTSQRPACPIFCPLRLKLTRRWNRHPDAAMLLLFWRGFESTYFPENIVP
ncbi:uncharacterized protein BO72DRAFT_462446 [Aspergillus fijiensis CBS 313.89]|uniref:Uncharacterized protein n=1 Tax=Aspergillus fijiensis CBS 313.89 TaxID=1448319 RepID=A0A8G1RJQ7_9EURO|nr:uncharacterized protein BO72DRAFT_462446 [Aspergillus fijiensis CBS 313.89]RAK73000.1 hypothetical protein BO72DRAFT_462446 [Aspergillus fijiensis CBS 313.89]